MSSVDSKQFKLWKARDKLKKVAFLDLFQSLWLSGAYIFWALTAGELDKDWNPCPYYCEVDPALTEIFPCGLSIILCFAIICKFVTIWNCFMLMLAAWTAKSRERAEDLTWGWRRSSFVALLICSVAVLYYFPFIIFYAFLPSHDPTHSNFLFMFHHGVTSILALVFDFLCNCYFHQVVNQFRDVFDA